MTPCALIIEDDQSLREAICACAADAGYEAKQAESFKQAKSAIKNQHTIVLCDIALGDGNGIDLIPEIKKKWPATPVIIMTADPSIDSATQAFKNGANDYLKKPFELENLIELLERYKPVSGNDQSEIKSKAMVQTMQIANKVAPFPVSVLINGESGSGKEVLAKFIHQNSKRSSGPFVAINCASIPSDLMESILFGHAKGAFTGASQATIGKIQQANGGTLFLDEIGEMPIALQAKILRVIQEKEVEPIGAKTTIPVDVRFISATHRDLQELIKTGEFRSDLFYRLNVFPIEIPPLRDRSEDIIEIAKSLIHKHQDQYSKSGVRISSSAIEAILAYHWPGNVRELENAIQRALVMCGDEIHGNDLGLPTQNDVENKISMALEDIENAAISYIANICENDFGKMAKILGLTEKTLLEKMGRSSKKE